MQPFVGTISRERGLSWVEQLSAEPLAWTEPAATVAAWSWLTQSAGLAQSSFSDGTRRLFRVKVDCGRLRKFRLVLYVFRLVYEWWGVCCGRNLNEPNFKSRTLSSVINPKAEMWLVWSRFPQRDFRSKNRPRRGCCPQCQGWPGSRKGRWDRGLGRCADRPGSLWRLPCGGPCSAYSSEQWNRSSAFEGGLEAKQRALSGSSLKRRGKSKWELPAGVELGEACVCFPRWKKYWCIYVLVGWCGAGEAGRCRGSGGLVMGWAGLSGQEDSRGTSL